MDKQDAPIGKFVHRHISQMKVLARLMEHELDASKGKEIVLDRDIAESMLDTLDIFVEDLEASTGMPRESRAERSAEKPQVTRLN